jgi:hypothetical protein
METSLSELHARTELTTIKLAAQLIERGRGSPERVALRAREIAAAVDRLCAALERSAAELRQLAATLREDGRSPT